MRKITIILLCTIFWGCPGEDLGERNTFYPENIEVLGPQTTYKVGDKLKIRITIPYDLSDGEYGCYLKEKDFTIDIADMYFFETSKDDMPHYAIFEQPLIVEKGEMSSLASHIFSMERNDLENQFELVIAVSLIRTGSFSLSDTSPYSNVLRFLLMGDGCEKLSGIDTTFKNGGIGYYEFEVTE